MMLRPEVSSPAQAPTEALITSLRTEPLILDGGLGTQLAARGNDVSSALWSADVLRSRPDEVAAAHADFFAAGAQLATTCSYQVSYTGFAAQGYSEDEVDALLQRSVTLARNAAAAAPGVSRRWVFASIGPEGASRGDGSEYTGDTPLTQHELAQWHRRRILTLSRARPDALLCETLPSLREIAALCETLAAVDTPAILSFTVASGALRSKEALADACRIAAQLPTLAAISVNCSSVADTDIALRELRQHTELPLLAYPNSGEHWDAVSRSWHGDTHTLTDRVHDWLSLGVCGIGGCCRVGTDEIAAIAHAVRENSVTASPQR